MPGFKIDETKLRSSLPPPTSSYSEDAKYGLGFLGLAVGIIALVLLALWQLLRAFGG